MTTLLLVRHGANDWVHGRLAGRIPGVHLNDEGRRQAANVAARLADLPIEAVYASPLDRTVETAQAIAGPRGLPLRLVEALQEVDYGEWQGAELKELYKHELWPGVQHYPSGTRFPNGETLGETQIRIVTALDALRVRHPKGLIVVVSHADAIRLAIAYYVGIHVDLFQRLEVATCSVTAIGFTRMGPRLLAYNDTGSLAHLKPKPEEAKATEQEQAAQTGPAPGATPEQNSVESTNGVEAPLATAPGEAAQQ
ncbi:MAG: MSMEG_4193 family putative phosphomutase [Chloroflexi bacterium]|nr:MSMEG_4193 family putative phosphomutase [Chloroflexota bacterium]